MCAKKTTELRSNEDSLSYQAERYKAQNELLIQAYEKIQKTISELRKTEDLLVESEKLASLGELIATVSHEIRSPLGAISASSNIISELTAAMQVETFNIARSLTEKEFKAITPFLSIPFNNEDFSIEVTESQKLLFVDGLHKSMLSTDDWSIELILKTGLAKPEYADLLRPILKSKRKKEILIYLGNYQTLKTSIWILKESSDKATKLIDELKSYSYRNTGEQVEFSLSASIINTLNIYRSKLHAMNIVQNIDEVTILGDVDRLSQVWINLLNNAAQASNFKGKIELSVLEDENKKWVSIKDYAGGMSKEVQEKIFQPFFTTKENGQGTGLGLSVVKRIVEEHKGHIRFEVEDGVGTNAIVEFKKEKNENIIRE